MPTRAVRRRLLVASIVAVALCRASYVAAQTRDAGIPHLRKQGTATQLVVDGVPILLRGGELGNSTASSVAEMRAVWPRLRAMHLNAVVAPVYWELIEPQEGRYEFASVDSLIVAARANQMHLVLLWFGSWKNSMSSYVPAYVKTNQARFPRTESTRRAGQEILSPFVAANYDADARVFRALMRHLRTFDGTRHTVVMVQVENEIGMIPTARDHSALADSLYAQPVPRELLDYLRAHRDALATEMRARISAGGDRASGSWEEVFGAGVQTEELFMAWYFARYVQQVSAAGKAEYPLPMYANAALMRPGFLPGRYVSAGPLPHLVDVWRAAAPSLDFISPDIYFPNFVEWADRYVRAGNPLFIPEAALIGQVAVNALYVFGAHDAIGFSPFAIESADPAITPLTSSFALLEQLTPVILAHQGRSAMAGVMPPTAFDGTVDQSPQKVVLGDYALTVAFQSPPIPAGADTSRRAGIIFGFPRGPAAVMRTGGGIIIALAPDEFLIAGSGLTVTFAPAAPGAQPIAGILRTQEGHYENGRWMGGRWLNGDQTNQGRHVQLGAQEFSMQRVKLYRYR
jgi:beta-galactosidase GanA